MRWWFAVGLLAATIAMGWAQAPLTIHWLSQDPTGGPIRISGQRVESRFPSVSADGQTAVFQVGSGPMAQIWQAVWDTVSNRWTSNPVPVPGSNPPATLQGLHPVLSADAHHLAFASTQPYGGLTGTNGKQQVYVLDRLQNRLVPISVLWQDADNDGLRDTFSPANGNCFPVHISADGRIVAFLAESPAALNIVDTEGDGISDAMANPPRGWLVLIHDRDADGNGVYDEAGIGSTRTFVVSYDWNAQNNQPLIASAAALHVSANGRFIAFVTPVNPTNPDERWRLIVRDWQNENLTDPQQPFGILARIDDAYAPSLSDDGLYVAYLTPTQQDNDGDGQVNEDPVDGQDNDNDGLVDEDPLETYPYAPIDLVVRQLVDPATGQPPAQVRELRLSGLPLPPQGGAADGASGWGYNDWWGAITLAVDPQNPNLVYAVFHSWATNLIDFARVDERLVTPIAANAPALKFYQGVANIFVARFDLNPNAPNPVQLWQLGAWGQRGLPVSLKPNGNNTYRLPLASSLIPTVSFVAGGRLFILFQSLAPFDTGDDNGLWDVYLADVPLP